ncbi:MAG: DUF7689 domain-containing protein [Rhizomicrobium sp.]
MDAYYKQFFPMISDVAGKQTSQKDQKYNCIAHAFDDDQNFWWPKPRAFWPISYANMTAMEAFEAWFAADGWEETQNQSVEEGFKKIALYALNGIPTHAARLLADGRWTSKLGIDIDLAHALDDLTGPAYGVVIRFYQKPIS